MLPGKFQSMLVLLLVVVVVVSHIYIILYNMYVVVCMYLYIYMYLSVYVYLISEYWLVVFTLISPVLTCSWSYVILDAFCGWVAQVPGLRVASMGNRSVIG